MYILNNLDPAEEKSIALENQERKLKDELFI